MEMIEMIEEEEANELRPLPEKQARVAQVLANAFGHRWAMDGEKAISALVEGRKQPLTHYEWGIDAPSIIDGVVVHKSGRHSVRWKIQRSGEVVMTLGLPYDDRSLIIITKQGGSITLHVAGAYRPLRFFKDEWEFLDEPCLVSWVAPSNPWPTRDNPWAECERLHIIARAKRALRALGAWAPGILDLKQQEEEEVNNV